LEARKLIQTEINGKSNVAAFRNKAKEVLCEFYSLHDLDPELRINEIAVKLIKDDIKGKLLTIITLTLMS